MMHGMSEDKKAPFETLQIRLPADMLKAIDAIVADRMERPTRTLVIREMIARGLESVKV
jgi:metal-responsive CopG/Arc/MetJ family transcriptional regulator